tara:strand:+ start:110 stop:388 length:279 start_codon:yes stop_codon:yes gene_type:complete
MKSRKQWFNDMKAKYDGPIYDDGCKISELCERADEEMSANWEGKGHGSMFQKGDGDSTGFTSAAQDEFDAIYTELEGALRKAGLMKDRAAGI